MTIDAALEEDQMKKANDETYDRLEEMDANKWNLVDKEKWLVYMR